MKDKMRRDYLMLYINAGIAAYLAFYFFIIPTFLVLRNLNDPALKSGGIVSEAWRMHRNLTPQYGDWVEKRIASGRAANVHYLNVPATEWPLFGCVFYLWATERLQEEWEKDNSLSPEAPAIYGRETIEMCKDLLLDPKHHTWVKTHWGENYMYDENVFFRSLLIAGLTSYEKLTDSGDCVALLSDQVETLSYDLYRSPHGVLYDYPDECYPIDVFAAVAWMRLSDEVVGADCSSFVANERRAFVGGNADKNGLIPWLVDPRTGKQFEASRGIVNSHVLIFAPDLYPDLAKKWYETYEKHFWQENWFAAGWREYYRDRPGSEWTFDVDAGPIIAGFSPAANAFGLAAAKANGRLDHAYTLAAQILTACWPLPDGTCLGARIMSLPAWRDAPYLGELGILWQLTSKVNDKVELKHGGSWAGFVYFGLMFYFGIGMLILLATFGKLWFWSRREKKFEVFGLRAQVRIWISLLALSLIFFLLSMSVWSLVFLMLAQALPVVRKIKKELIKIEESANE